MRNIGLRTAKIMLGCAIVIGFIGCGKSEQQLQEEARQKVQAEEARAQAEEARAQAAKEKELIEGFKSKLISNLKDPGSVQFRELALNSSGSALCGEYNAKNSYGGYVGFKRFILNGDELMVEDPSPSGFDAAMSNVKFLEAMAAKVCD